MVCDSLRARANNVNSDLVQNFVELISVQSGNLLLHHWFLGSDNFYFTDLPWFVVLGSVFGLKAWLIWFEPVVVYALLLLAALHLVNRSRPDGAPAWPGVAMILLLIGVPFNCGANVFLHAGIHAATIMLCLYAVALIEPVLARRHFSPLRFFGFVILTFAAVSSDPQAQAYFTAPVLIWIVLQFWLAPGWRADDALLFGTTLLAAGAGAFWPHFIAHNHGFATTLNFNTGFVPDPAALEHNAVAVLRAWQVLFTAQPDVLTAFAGGAWLAASRMFTACLVLGFCLVIIARAPRRPHDGVTQLLVIGALCLCAADFLSQTFATAIGPGPGYPRGAIRYVAPAFVFACVAAVIEIQRVLALSGAVWRRLGRAIGLCLTLMFLLGVAQQANHDLHARAGIRAAPQYALATWLRARRLRYGVADYWTAQMITALSAGHVMADAVYGADRLTPFQLVLDTSRFDTGRRPDFVAILPGNVFNVTAAEVQATYGKPRETCRVGDYTVIITR
jgi:hypothetical protein